MSDFAGVHLVRHKDFLPQFPQFLNFAFDFGILRDEGFVHEIKFCLNRNLQVFQNVLEFCFEDAEVILYFDFFPLDFLFKLVNILLLVLQQKYQILGKQLSLICVQELQLRR